MISFLANQCPRIRADVDLHNHVAEPARIRLGLVRRVGRNEQPIASFHFESLAALDRLTSIFTGNDTVLITQVLAVGDSSPENHLAGASGENVKIIRAGMHLRVIPNTVDLGEAQNRMITVHAIEHEDAEIARLDMNGATAERLGAAATGLSGGLPGFFGQFSVGLPNIVDVPVSDGGSIRG